MLRVTPGIDPHTYEAVSTGKVDSSSARRGDRSGHGTGEAGAGSAPPVSLGDCTANVGSQVFGEDVYQPDGGYHGAVSGGDSMRPASSTSELGAAATGAIRRTMMPSISRPGLAELGRILGSGGGKGRSADDSLSDGAGPQHCGGRRHDAGILVGSVKRIPGYKQYVAIDGMTDNPRYALYRPGIPCFTVPEPEMRNASTW